MKKRPSIIAFSALVVSAAFVSIGVSPAFAGDWAWDSKNCVPSNQYVYTSSRGTGKVTHAHQVGSVVHSSVFDNGTVVANRTKTFYFGLTQGASVAGAGTTGANYYCG